MIQDEEVRTAISAIARTKPGYFLFKHLQRVALSESPSTEVGALQAHEGKRRFALQLMGLMAEAANAEPSSDRRIDADDTQRIERKPVAVSSRRGTERRVEPYADAGTAG